MEIQRFYMAGAKARAHGLGGPNGHNMLFIDIYADQLSATLPVQRIVDETCPTWTNKVRDKGGSGVAKGGTKTLGQMPRISLEVKLHH